MMLFFQWLNLWKPVQATEREEDINYPAGIAQLVERNLAKVEVASSNLVSRSILSIKEKI
jgi:hypothetical protein